MEREALNGHWLVGDWALRELARVVLDGDEARVSWPGTRRPELTVTVSGWTKVSGGAEGAVTRWEADVDDGRGSARAWLAALEGGELVGSLVGGGPLLRARPLEMAPEALLGAWEVSSVGPRRSRRALLWHVVGDTVEIRRVGRVVAYTGLWVTAKDGRRVVLVDAKGSAVEVRLWPLGEGWLACETDTSLSYVLHREGAAPPSAWTPPAAADEEEALAPPPDDGDAPPDQEAP